MKRLCKRYLLLLLASMLVFSMPMTAYAAEETTGEEGAKEGGGEKGESEGGDAKYDDPMYIANPPDAIDEILKDERFEGAVEQIQWLTKIFDHYSIQLISVCAFLIIAAAFLKNALAGAYCANSKFWDKVADAHAKRDALNFSAVKGYFTGGQYQNTTIAGFKDGLLWLVPNIKAFTDFDDADIQPKQYFMKSIPQMCVCVIIGIFIYNGYYRDTAAVVGEFGSEAFNRVMTAASPSEFLDKITQTTGMPTLLTDGRTDVQGKILNKIADAGRKACITEFNLTSTAQKIRVSAQVENWVLSKIQPEIADYCKDEEDNAWKLSAKVKLVPATSSHDGEAVDVGDENATTQVKIFMTEEPVAKLGEGTDTPWIFDSVEKSKPEKQMLYLRVIVTAVKTQSSGGANAGKDVDGENDVKPGQGTEWSDEHITLNVTLDTKESGTTSYTIPKVIDGYTIRPAKNASGSRPEVVAVSGRTDVVELIVDSSFTKGEISFTQNNVYVLDGKGIKHHFTLNVQ